VWSWPIRWRGAKSPLLGPGQPSLIFVGDMADLFHPDRPVEVLDRVLAGIVYSRHIGQLLTKRPGVMRTYFEELRRSARWLSWPHPLFGASNFDPMVATFDAIVSRLWLGTSVERQAEADRRREDLRALSDMGFTTFVSYEPALGPADWKGWEFADQIISGGESGARARPSHPAWHRATRDFCDTVGIAYFFKQWGAWREATPAEPIGHGSEPSEFGSLGLNGEFRPGVLIGISSGIAALMLRFGKAGAGRLLDGREYTELPGEGGGPPRTAYRPSAQREVEPA
jgi:protein gp37